MALPVTSDINKVSKTLSPAPPGNLPGAAPNPFVRGPQYNNQFAQSTTDAQASVNAGKPDYWNPISQMQRIEDNRPVTQTADFRRLAQLLPDAPTEYELGNQLWEARVNAPSRNRRDRLDNSAGWAAQEAVRDRYRQMQDQHSQGLKDAFNLASSSLHNRAALHNEELIADAQNRANIAQTGLQAHGYAYGTDQAARTADADRILQKLRDEQVVRYQNAEIEQQKREGAVRAFADVGPDAAASLYPDLAKAFGQTGGNETYEKLIRTPGSYATQRRAAFEAAAKRMGVPDEKVGQVLTRADVNLTDKGIRDAWHSILLEDQPLVRPGWGENEGTPIIDKNQPFAEQPSRLARYYNGPLGQFTEMMATPFTIPLQIRRAVAGRQPGPDDLVVQTNQGPQIIPNGRQYREVNRFYGESRK